MDRQAELKMNLIHGQLKMKYHLVIMESILFLDMHLQIRLIEKSTQSETTGGILTVTQCRFTH